MNSSDWVKKLSKQRGAIHCLDIDLDFGGGKYFASLRLSRGDRGILEVVMLWPYNHLVLHDIFWSKSIDQ